MGILCSYWKLVCNTGSWNDLGPSSSAAMELQLDFKICITVAMPFVNELAKDCNATEHASLIATLNGLR